MKTNQDHIVIYSAAGCLVLADRRRLLGRVRGVSLGDIVRVEVDRLTQYLSTMCVIPIK